ncbi:DNA-processing protein DprA [Marinimicrobium sp. C6131]|uniref:DNA-processing protein DprA n=1 Tax=unclassified Marinimicrobium TaxID=2632100 RepID=UPI00223E5B31|nr:DNA-processing protein DprA [Marinimicrobium sp. C6131]UZJ44413.1 DNA-processing protein DprA [Marinimicrobium sp. C6131]
MRDIKRQPADLVSPAALEVMRECQPVIDEGRLQRLLKRGFLLSQVIEHWQSRAIWVVSRADPEYPRRLKARLREDAPAVLYGCGDISILETGGLAVVGSRRVSDDLVDYTMSVGSLAASAGRTVISGGARGVDQAAMRGASESGGKVIGVLAENLEKTVMNREERNRLRGGNLVLVSAYDPSAGFNVGHAMQRNKLIYALADTSLVVSSDLKKGGTWAGAEEQLDKLKFVPVFVRSTGESSAALDALREKGALPWPNPQDVASLDDVFNVAMPTTFPQADLPLFSSEEAPSVDTQSSPPVNVAAAGQLAAVVECLPSITLGSAAQVDVSTETPQPELTPAEALFAVVREAIQQLASEPVKDTEVAAALDVSNAQAKEWLTRLVKEGVLEKKKKPVSYIVKQKRLL